VPIASAQAIRWRIALTWENCWWRYQEDSIVSRNNLFSHFEETVHQVEDPAQSPPKALMKERNDGKQTLRKPPSSIGPKYVILYGRGLVRPSSMDKQHMAELNMESVLQRNKMNHSHVMKKLPIIILSTT
jgi:hypothetical protein